MTGLCFLAVLGISRIGRFGHIWALLIGGGATLGALLCFTAVAHRYQHDLFAPLVLLTAVGVVWVANQNGKIWQLSRVALSLLLLLGIWQSLSFAHYELEWAKHWISSNTPSRAQVRRNKSVHHLLILNRYVPKSLR